MKREAFSVENAVDDGWVKTLMLPRRVVPTALATGTRVGEVEIAEVIGEGSAGIVYLAVDPSLERRVAVKEYLPSSLASRSADGQVVVRSAGLMTAYRAGLEGFIAEARLLARFDHPSLVKVYRVWEANGTAYFVMPFYEGPTLSRALADLGHPPGEAMLRGLLMPLLEALEMIHRAGQLHGDISPDNIVLSASGPVLLDFGVARRAVGASGHAPTVMLQRGYAPIEQYGESDALKAGPWTDLYALGSVLHFAITGDAPNLSVERLWDDWLEPLAKVAQGRYGPEWLAAVDAMLAVRPADRPQDVASLRRLLVPSTDAPVSETAVLPSLASVSSTPFLEPLRMSAHPPITAVEMTALVEVEPVGVRSGLRRSVVLASIGVGLVIACGLLVRSLTASVEHAEVSRVAVPGSAAMRIEPPKLQKPRDLIPAPLPIKVAEPLTRTPSDVHPAKVSTALRPVVTTKIGHTDDASVQPNHEQTFEPKQQAPAVPSSANWPARCFDILQRASLERVSDEETAFLRESCR